MIFSGFGEVAGVTDRPTSVVGLSRFFGGPVRRVVRKYSMAVQASSLMVAIAALMFGVIRP